MSRFVVPVITYKTIEITGWEAEEFTTRGLMEIAEEFAATGKHPGHAGLDIREVDDP